MRAIGLFAVVLITGCLALSDDEPATSTNASELTVTAIARRSTWRYWDRGGDLGTTWRAMTFNDSTWASGAGPLGYGESYLGTTIGYGSSSSNKHITTYFRTPFTVSDPAAVRAITGELLYDDGIVVYLNGHEIGRQGVPTPTTARTLAAGHEASPSSYERYDWSAQIPHLVAGVNTIAVEVHQQTVSSSDLVFDLALTLETAAPPPPPSTGGIPRGFTWSYWDRGGDLGTAWRQLGFDDGAWARGAAPLGYGEPYIATTVSYGPSSTNKHVTTYVRGQFVVDDPTIPADLVFEVLYDDGLVVYLNGNRLIASPSMGSGPTTPSTLASDHEATRYETWTFNGAPHYLRAGLNQLAIEVHQTHPASSDLVFDMSVTVKPLPPPSDEEIPRGSQWIYWDRGGDLGTAWREPFYTGEPGFPDGGWRFNTAPFGYGEPYLATTIGYGPSASNKYITSYFRHGFDVDDAALVTAIRGELLYDDGAVVYLNGHEIARRAMPSGTITASTLSSGHEIGFVYETFDWSHAHQFLVTGWNLIAVEIHQQSSSSSDLTFDLALDLQSSLTCPVTGCPRVAYGLGDLWDVWVAPGGVVWAVGERGMVGVRDPAIGDDWCWCAPAGTTDWLKGVWGTGDDDVWIVGGDAGVGTPERGSTVLHWNGTALRTVDIGAGTDSHMTGVWSSGPNDVWIVGVNAAVRHWNGTTWQNRNLPAGHHAMGVWGSGPDDVYVAGRHVVKGGGSAAVVHHWNPATGAWDTSASYFEASVTGVGFHAIEGTGPNDIWAVGDMFAATGGGPGFTVHFDGTSWNEVATPDHVASDRRFMDLTLGGPGGPGPWIAGYYGTAVRFDNPGWTVAGEETRGLRGIDADADEMWAVGQDGMVIAWGPTGWYVQRAATPDPSE